MGSVGHGRDRIELGRDAGVAEKKLGTKPSALFLRLLKMEETHAVELRKIKAMDYL